MTNVEFAQLNASLPPVSDQTVPVFIYALLDPDSLEARYIGKSIRPVQRLCNHMSERSACHRSHWLQGLRSKGQRPVMVILERVDGLWPWQEAERYWIAYARTLGWPITNGTSGGDGVPGLSAESRARMAATWRGRKHRPESVELMRRASTGRRASPATRAKHSAAMRGRSITWGDKLSAALRKLDDAAIKDVEERLLAGERVTALAAELGLHRTTVSKIKKGTYRDKYRS